MATATGPQFAVWRDDGGPHDAVRTDVVDGVSEWFRPAGDDPMRAWRYRTDLVEEGSLSNGRIDVLAWRYEAEPLPAVWGVAAERGTVLIDGVTFSDLRSGDEPRFSRYIDWHGVFMQLGVAAAGHVVREPGR